MRTEATARASVPARSGAAAPHPRLEALFQALDRERVEWCVLRGEAELAEPQKDVDLLVARADLARFGRVAAELGFARVPAWGYGPHAFFVAYDAPGDAWLKLDVVTELAYGPNHSLASGAEAECLARCRRVAGISLLAPDDAFWTLLLHRLLDKGAVGARDAAALQALAGSARTDSTLARLAGSLCPSGWSADRLVAAAAQGEWPALGSLGPPMAAAWRARRPGDARRRAAANAGRRWAGKVARHTKRCGVRVAVLAPDGAGKSTVVGAVAESFYLPARSVRMGLYRTSRPGRRRGLRGVGLARQLSAQWNGWLRGAYHRRRGRLVLFDRYAYDALMPTRFRYGRLGRIRRRLLAGAIRPPELVLFLDAPGEVLHARKGEKTVEMLERQRQAYRELLRRLPRAVVVDASREPDEVRRAATAAIWHEYVRRWGM